MFVPALLLYFRFNPLQTQAGTAEATLDCDGPLNVFGPGGTGNVSPVAGTPGTAHIQAIVNRPGQDIVLTATVNVVGPTSANGLTLTLSATSVQCGTRSRPPSRLSTPTALQSAMAPRSTSPRTRAAALPAALRARRATYNCTVPAPAAPAAPSVNPPVTGTGTGSITPPNTGDAGLAATNTGTSSLFVIAGAMDLALTGFASFKFSRDR